MRLTVVVPIILCLFDTKTFVNADISPRKVLDFIQHYSEDWTYPNVVAIAKSAHYSRFAKDVVGRVDITNTFLGQQANTEYLFGLFASLGASNKTKLIGVPTSVTYSQVLLQGNIVSVALMAQLDWTIATVPAQFNVIWMLNDEGQVTQYDIEFVRADWLLSTMIPLLAPSMKREVEAEGFHAPTNQTELFTLTAALQICAAHEAQCLGKNRQFASKDACIKFITKERPMGEIWQSGQDTGICRYLHSNMIWSRPEENCPYLGPSGGDMCISRNYTNFVNTNPFPSPFISAPGGVSLPTSVSQTIEGPHNNSRDMTLNAH